jgi:hypothetical protein
MEPSSGESPMRLQAVPKASLPIIAPRAESIRPPPDPQAVRRRQMATVRARTASCLAPKEANRVTGKSSVRPRARHTRQSSSHLLLQPRIRHMVLRSPGRATRRRTLRPECAFLRARRHPSAGQPRWAKLRALGRAFAPSIFSPGRIQRHSMGWGHSGRPLAACNSYGASPGRFMRSSPTLGMAPPWQWAWRRGISLTWQVAHNASFL